MIKVNRPNSIPFRLHDGSVLLEFKGRYLQNQNRRAARQATLDFDFKKSGNRDNLKIELTCTAFEGEKILLDLKNSLVIYKADGRQIGTTRVAQISIDHTSLVISGHYIHSKPHEAFGMRYLDDDLVEFNALFDISKLEMTEFKSQIDMGLRMDSNLYPLLRLY